MSAAADRGPFYRRLIARFAAIEDGAILRVAFFSLLLGTLSVLYLDFRELMSLEGAVSEPAVMPILPFLPGTDPASPTHRPDITTDRAVLEQNLTVELRPGGVLELTGTIDPGAFERFVTETEARGEYITTVALNSPGGAVRTAIEIGTRIRDLGYDTVLRPGAICASSCPLLLAAGVRRSAADGTAVGVHQIFVAAPVADLTDLMRDMGGALHEAQLTTALITRYLAQMDVDPALWLHALETPPQSLYYLSADELVTYRLVTEPVLAPGV